jgi:hypothetical protein
MKKGKGIRCFLTRMLTDFWIEFGLTRVEVKSAA